MSIIKEGRTSNIECLRCIAMLFIVLNHCILHIVTKRLSLDTEPIFFCLMNFVYQVGIQWSKSFCIDIRIFSRKDNKKYYKLGKSYKAMVKRVLLFRNYICILYWNSQETIEFPRINSCFNAYKI